MEVNAETQRTQKNISYRPPMNAGGNGEVSEREKTF